MRSVRGGVMRGVGMDVTCVACALALFGCQSTTPTVVQTKTAFDPAAAAFIKKTGEAKISGHAFWRDGDGGTIEAAGEIVRLVPATPYARERFSALYGSAHSLPAGRIPKVETDPAYADYTRTTRAESNGRFEFDHVAPGEYFVTTQIVVHDKRQQLKFQSGIYSDIVKVGEAGGAMYETVTVTAKDDKTIKLVMTND